ncbi:MAG: hypothetical protein M3R17_17150 [Bacteroidota bacterium]|nr:hypothetical protein [Bacteroidota bacterium]
MKNEKITKEFFKTKIKLPSTTPSSTIQTSTFAATLEEYNAIGHSRNSRKVNYSQGSRD